MINNEKIRCYKFSGKNGFWSIIACDDPDLAKYHFLSEYKVSEEAFKKEIKMERISTSYKVKVPYFMKHVTVGYLTTQIKFFPRVLQDSII